MRRPSNPNPAAPSLILVALILSGCPENEMSPAPKDTGRADSPGAQDIQTTDLDLDLGALTGRATLVVVPSAGKVTLNVAGLTLGKLTLDGEEVAMDITDGVLSIAAPGAPDPVTIVVDYAFPARTPATFDGWMSSLGVSFVWPYFCSNFFPCNPSMEDGVTFTMRVVGVNDGLTAIYPTSTHGDGPAYIAAVAVGDYTKLDLGTTTAGTTLSAWYLPGQRGLEDATAGTAHLVRAFDYFEQTYGPYNFGPEAGTVEVDWGADSWGGISTS